MSSECVITGAVDVWSLGGSLFAAAFGEEQQCMIVPQTLQRPAGQSPCDGSALSAISGRISFPKNWYAANCMTVILWSFLIALTLKNSVI